MMTSFLTNKPKSVTMLILIEATPSNVHKDDFLVHKDNMLEACQVKMLFNLNLVVVTSKGDFMDNYRSFYLCKNPSVLGIVSLSASFEDHRSQKPTLGVIPEWLAKEEVAQGNLTPSDRFNQVRDAIQRRVSAGQPIPLEWVREYNRHKP